MENNFGLGFNDAKFSDRTLLIEIIPDDNRRVDSNSNDRTPQLEIIPDSTDDSLPDSFRNRKRCRVYEFKDSSAHEVVQSNGIPATQMKAIHVNTLILAAKSPFFYKMFSNGMAESNQHYVTLEIQESVRAISYKGFQNLIKSEKTELAYRLSSPICGQKEAAFMDLMKFMYTNTLSSSTPSALLDVLMAANKYEVASCMNYCLQLLPKLPMTCELALLYLDLPSTVLMADTTRPLTDAAKEFLVARFKDISKFQKEMLSLPLAGIVAILSSDDLRVDSEDM